MDLRISADADIKRLREMVQKLEEKNAGLKTLDSPRLGRESANTANRYISDRMNSSSSPVSKVAVKLHLDEVPLLDLSDVDSEEEDSWLYMSPINPPTPAQKSVSPYKYLKGSIDHQTDLNRVRGSLMAKLESIAAQEESISRHDHQEPQPKDRNMSDMNRTYHMDEGYRRKDFEEDDLEPLNISGSDTYPIRRRGTPTGATPAKPPQTKLYRAWENISFGDDDDMENDQQFDEAPVVRRRAPKPVTPGRQSMRYQDEQDSGVVKPRGAMTQNFSIETPDDDDDDDDLECARVVRRRGPRTATQTGQSVARMPDDDIPLVTKVRPRGQPPQQNLSINVPSDDDEEVNEAPIRRRGAARQSLPVGRSSAGSPQMAWQAEDDDGDNSGPVRPRRRAAPQSMYRDDGDDDFESQAPVVRRRSPASPKPTDDNLAVTAVRRRGGPQPDNQVRPRQQGGIPTPKRPKQSQLRVSQSAEIRRRSLPQVPSSSLQYPSSYSDNMASGTSQVRVRSASPAGRLAMKSEAPVVPRQSKLVTPRRIPTPRASNSYYSTGNDENWQDGCY